MSRARIGDSVMVQRALKVKKATLVGLGKDSGGPWALVEYANGERAIVHPDRVKKIVDA